MIRHHKSKRGFTLVELLTVLTIMLILAGLMVNYGLATNPAGARQGAISQITQGLEEARMDAIETGGTVYFGIAGTDAPVAGLRLHSYILFRLQTATEQPDATKRTQVILSAWQPLPQGIYFDPTVLATATVKTSVSSLPQNVSDVQALEFGSLGQLESGSTAAILSFVPAVFNTQDNELTPKPKQSGFSLEIYRLSGRVNITIDTAPGSLTQNN